MANRKENLACFLRPIWKLAKQIAYEIFCQSDGLQERKVMFVFQEQKCFNLSNFTNNRTPLEMLFREIDESFQNNYSIEFLPTAASVISITFFNYLFGN